MHGNIHPGKEAYEATTFGWMLPCMLLVQSIIILLEGINGHLDFWYGDSHQWKVASLLVGCG